MPKKRYKFIITIIVISFLSLIHHVASDEAAIMARLAQSLRPTPSGWSGTNYCKWQGVSCESNKVTSINLSSRSLSGTVPPEIVQLSNLQSLNLQRNQLSGPIPPLSNHASLEDISLDYNNFNSTPTNFLSGLPSLQTFSMNNNTFLAPWSIPDGLRNSSSLTSFYVTWSNIVGEIPDFFDDLPNLQSLRLSYNSMTGSLPRSLAKSSIQNLWLNNVGFSGQLDVLGAMTQLRVAWVHVNSFTGPIPDLSACTDLTEIQFRDNDLTGVIPVSLTRLPKLLNLSLQNNKFQGPMPSFPKGLQVSLGNTNKFCTTNPGPCDPQVTILLEAVSAFGYPSTLADSWEGNDPCGNSWRFIVCERGSVTKVNFGRQNWSGTISPTFANLTSLKALYLNDNRLYGTIPTSLTSLRQLELIDISNNNISGRIPPFAGSVTVRTSGNQFIGQDIPIFNPDNSSSRNNGVNVPSGPNNVRRRSTISPWIIVVPVIVVIVILAIVGFVVYQRYYLKKKGKKKWFGKETEAGNKKEKKTLTKLNTESPIMSSSAIGTPLSSGERSDYHVYDGGNVTIPIEVLREVTDNFSENNILGKGGFGIVYKGQLHDGTRIAVKRMESSVVKDKGMNEFKAEIEVLTKVRHRHLVALHGFCENGNERLLVYEYMPQGCLGRHLFEWQEKEIAPLTWNQRMIIALDVARGVEYLHSLAQTSFIHRDLKPSNILLGDDMRAKVSDFGLVKSAPDGKYSLETRLAGTFGYLAPEYAATGRVTTKVDVFAFGVVLMEIITGRKALDDSLPEDKSHLVTWFRRLLNDKNEIKTALDPIIIPSATADEEAFQSIWKVAELAGHCTARESYQRPDMSHAVNVLSPLVEQWTPAPDEEDSLGIDLDMGLPQVLQKWKASEEESTMTSGFFSSGTSANKANSEFTSSSDSNSGR